MDDKIHEYNSLNNIPFINLSSLLIFEVMLDAVEKNYEYWNCEGTWESQKGVYDFKKKWGANDMR